MRKSCWRLLIIFEIIQIYLIFYTIVLTNLFYFFWWGLWRDWYLRCLIRFERRRILIAIILAIKWPLFQNFLTLVNYWSLPRIENRRLKSGVACTHLLFYTFHIDHIYSFAWFVHLGVNSKFQLFFAQISICGAYYHARSLIWKGEIVLWIFIWRSVI